MMMVWLIRNRLYVASILWGLMGSINLAADSTVTGTIAFDGKPVHEGRILFHLDNGKLIGAMIENGYYKARRLPTGTLKVTVKGKGLPLKYRTKESSPLQVDLHQGQNRLRCDLLYGEFIDQDLVTKDIVERFDDNEFDRKLWRIEALTPQVRNEVQDESLVSTVASGVQGIAPCIAYVDSLKGEFEVRCDLKILECPDDFNQFSNIELILFTPTTQYHSIIAIDRGSNPGTRSSALCYPIADDPAFKYTFASITRKGPHTTLWLRRRGKTMVMGVIDDGISREISRMPCDTIPMRLRAQCFASGPQKGPIKLRWDNFTIRMLNTKPRETPSPEKTTLEDNQDLKTAR